MSRDYRERPPVTEDRLDRILSGILSREFAMVSTVVVVAMLSGVLAAVALGMVF